MLSRRRPQAPQHKQADVEINALGASSASHYMWPLSLFHPSNVLVRDEEWCWNSGVFAPASILLHLGNTPIHVTRIAMQTEMVPEMGKVSHQIRLGDTRDTLQSACWYNGVCTNGEWTDIDLSSDPHRMSRFLEVVTHNSPSWVAWRRIRVWGSSS
jgi:hypothetical protein